MKRKIFSKLLMGAFLIASVSSFVSCKDYDDDINDLQKQIDAAALKTDLSNLQSTLASQISAAQSAAQAAQSTADQAVKDAAAAGDAAKAAATTAAVEVVKTAAEAAGTQAATAISNASAAQTAADAAADAAKAAQETADKAAAAAAAADKAAAGAAQSAAGAQSTADQAVKDAAAAQAAADVAKAAADAAQKAADDNKSAIDAAAAVAAAAKEAADKAAAAAAAIKATDLSGYYTKSEIDALLANVAKPASDYATAAKLNEEVKKLQDQLDKLNAQDFDALKNKVESFASAIDEIYTAVTNISLMVDDWTNSPWNYNLYPIKGRILNTKNHFTTQKIANVNNATSVGSAQKDGTFGKNDYFNNAANKANQTVTFKNGEYFNFDQGYIRVRVSPTNAELNASDLKFIDSQGNDINGAVKVVRVTPETAQFTRATSKSGIWRVYYALTDNVMNSNDLYSYTQTSWGGDKSFALAVGNTSVKGTDRFAVSEYNIAFRAVSRYIGYHSLENVGLQTSQWWAENYKLISNVTNRIKGAAAPNAGNVNDYSWDNEASVDNNVTADAARTTDTSTGAAARPYRVANGQSIFFNFGNYGENYLGWNTSEQTDETITKPRYAYVVLDEKNANVNNDASEWNAWKGYSIQGINTLWDLSTTTYPSITVTIPEDLKMGDEIAFRLFAVNWDGTLVDPDGYGFNVFVGTDAQTTNASLTFTALQPTGQIVYIPLDGTKIKSNEKPSTQNWPWFHNANWTGYSHDRIEFVTTNSGNAGTYVATEWKNVKYARVILSSGTELCYWPDNETREYNMSLSSGDSQDTPDWYLNLSLTKVLPTATDVKKLYTWKQSQLVNGVWTAVIYPETAENAADASVNTPWADTDWGYKGLNNGINGLVKTDGSGYVLGWGDDPRFVFTFANSAYNGNTKDYTNTVHIPGYDAVGDVVTANAYTNFQNAFLPDYVDGYILNLEDGVNKTLYDLVDYKTQHSSTIGYNFGHISSNNAYGYGDVNEGLYANYRDYVVVGETFQTIYACPFTDATITVSIGKYKDGVKLNTIGNKVAVGDQDWNYVYYNDPTIGKDVYDNTPSNNTFFDSGVDLGATAVTDAKWIEVSSKLGAEFIVPTLTDYLGHFKNIKSATFTSDGTKKEDYFTVDITALPSITLVRNAGTQDPKVDIPSHLNITGRCAFNHEHTISIPFYVKTTAK